MSFPSATFGRILSRDRQDHVALLVAADVTPFSEIAVRFGLLFIVGVVLAVTIQDWVYVAWMAAYFTISSLYMYGLRVVSQPVGRREYYQLLSLNMLAALVYAFLPVYLWFTYIPGLQAVALTGMVGHAMFNLVRHNHLSIPVIWEMSLVCASAIFIGVSQSGQFANLSHQIVMIASSIAVAIYYVTAQLNSIAVNVKLRKTVEEAIQTQKMQAIGQLTGGVAHDFNNILTVVKGNLELFEVLTDPVEQRKVVAEAQDAAGRAITVIAQLMAFSRQSTLRPETIDLPNFLVDVRQLIERALTENIILHVDVSKDLGGCRVDTNQLSSALLNLVLNAKDAMENGGEIFIEASDVDQPPAIIGGTLRPFRHLVLSVRDTGGGISKADMDRVFEPFFTTKGVGEGSGLGLSMVRGFAEQSGGGVTIKSVVGKGTTVSILLPCPKAEEDYERGRG